MGITFWINRFVVVLIGAFAIICAAQVLKGHDLRYSTLQGLIWGAITATVFVAARLYQSGRGQHCAICNDTPEMRRSSSGRSEI